MTEEKTRDQELGAIVEKLYSLTGIGDWAGAEHFLSDDLVITEADSLPYGGRYTGRSALQDLFVKVMEFWADPELTLRAITVGDDHAVGLVSLRVTSRATNRRLNLEIAETFRFEDDKIVEIIPYYFDTHMVVENCRG